MKEWERQWKDWSTIAVTVNVKQEAVMYDELLEQ